MAHGLYIGLNRRHKLSLRAHLCKLALHGMQLRRELLLLRHKLQHVCPHVIQLRAHGGDAADHGVVLGLDLGAMAERQRSSS